MTTPAPPSAAELDQAFQAALAAHAGGEFVRAAPIYDALLAVLPTHPALLLRRGVLARQMGDKAGAALWLRGAVAQAPTDPEAWSNLGNALADVEDPAAREAHLKAAQLAPDHLGVLLNAAGFLIAASAPAAAMPLLERLVARAPTEAMVWGMLSDCLLLLGQQEDAVAAMRRTTELNPRDAERWMKLGNLLYQEGCFGQARAAFETSLALRPDHPPTLTNLGLSLLWAPEALALHERALALDPAFQIAKMNRAVHMIRAGDAAEGWRAYEARSDNPGALTREFEQPLWQGQSLGPEAPLLLWAEQGTGDVLFMLRYLRDVMARVDTVILELHPGLGALTAGLPPGLTVLERGQLLPAFAHHLPTTSLRRVLGEAVPQIPYLSAPPASQKRWRDRMPAGGKAKVGLVWAGNSLQANDRLRSRTLKDLAPLFRHDGAVFYSLQVGSAGDQARQSIWPIVDLAPDLTDFAETAAALKTLDLLISVDTAVINLAGALGVETWAILAPNPCWRWGMSGERSPSYPSIRLFRRLAMANGDSEPKAAVVERLDAAFAEWLKTRAS